MRRQKRRPMHYYASCLFDGTVTATFPIRKPTPKKIKQENIKIDEDGVCDEGWYSAGKEFSDVRYENRTRFQDIMAIRLNSRRAIRDLILPEFAKMQRSIEALHQKVDGIQKILAEQKK